MKFRQSRRGLYFCTTDELKSFSETIESRSESISQLSTTDNQYSNRDKKRAEYARKLQKDMMWPSSTMMKNLITYNLITDTKVRVSDFDLADKIFGKAPEELCGKMTAPL